MPKIGDQQKEGRKSLIVDAALDLFAQKGIKETSMNDIVKHSGVSKGGLYVYFKSKDEIFMAIAERVLALRHSYIEDFPEEKGYRAKLAHYIRKTLYSFNLPDNARRIKFTFEFWLKHYSSDMIGDKTKEDYIGERFKYFEQDIRDILSQGIQSGEFKKDIAIESIPYIILTSIDGMAFASQMLCNPITKKRIEAFINLILDSITRGGANGK